jgi:hypothetical protein
MGDCCVKNTKYGITKSLPLFHKIRLMNAGKETYGMTQNKRWLIEVLKYRGKSWPGIENKDYETTEQTRLTDI